MSSATDSDDDDVHTFVCDIMPIRYPKSPQEAWHAQQIHRGAEALGKRCRVDIHKRVPKGLIADKQWLWQISLTSYLNRQHLGALLQQDTRVATRLKKIICECVTDLLDHHLVACTANIDRDVLLLTFRHIILPTQQQAG